MIHQQLVLDPFDDVVRSKHDCLDLLVVDAERFYEMA